MGSLLPEKRVIGSCYSIVLYNSWDVDVYLWYVFMLGFSSFVLRERLLMMFREDVVA